MTITIYLTQLTMMTLIFTGVGLALLKIYKVFKFRK